jgi:LacI family transcriptional regulator
MLFDEIEGKSLSASTVVLRPELVVRESTRAISARD